MTVACVFVQGNYPYTLEYVVRLERLARRYLDRPFRFVCLTDQPEAVRAAGLEAITIARLDVDQAYWHKVHLFNPAIGLTGRVLYLDLDTLIVSPLDPIVDDPAPFALAADELAQTRPVHDVNTIGRTILRKFNASVMTWHAGTFADLWTHWTPDVARRLQGDQDWYAEQCPHATALPAEWFPRLSSIGASGRMPAAAKVVLVKTPKNHLAAEKYPWFAAQWSAA